MAPMSPIDLCAPRLSRRSLLAAAGTTALALTLAACQKPGGSSKASATPTTSLSIPTTPYWSRNLGEVEQVQWVYPTGYLTSSVVNGAQWTLSLWTVGKEDADLTTEPIDGQLLEAWPAPNHTVTAHRDGTTTTISIFQTSTPTPDVTQDVKDYVHCTGGVLATLDDGSQVYLDWTGGSMEFKAAPTVSGTLLMVDWDAKPLSDNGGTLTYDGQALPGSPTGTPTTFDVTNQHGDTAYSDSIYATWEGQGTYRWERTTPDDPIHVPTSAPDGPWGSGSRPIATGQWEAWGALSWNTGDNTATDTLGNTVALIIDGTDVYALTQGADSAQTVTIVDNGKTLATIAAPGPIYGMDTASGNGAFIARTGTTIGTYGLGQ